MDPVEQLFVMLMVKKIEISSIGVNLLQLKIPEFCLLAHLHHYLAMLHHRLCVLPLESLAKSVLEAVSRLVSIWAFLNLEFRFHTISRADFDPFQQV